MNVNCLSVMHISIFQQFGFQSGRTVDKFAGEKINRFTHIHQSPDDLVKKVKMQRLLGQKTAACFQRCVGMDSFNSVYSTTYEVDKNTAHTIMIILLNSQLMFSKTT